MACDLHPQFGPLVIKNMSAAGLEPAAYGLKEHCTGAIRGVNQSLRPQIQGLCKLTLSIVSIVSIISTQVAHTLHTNTT